MIKKLLPLLLLFYLFWSPGLCSAATYQITDQELTRLEQIFDQLQSNNSEQQQKLEKASESLKRSENQINLLSEKLKAAEQSVQTAQDSLLRANQSLLAFEREAKKERNRLRFERNILLIGIGVLAFRG